MRKRASSTKSASGGGSGRSAGRVTGTGSGSGRKKARPAKGGPSSKGGSRRTSPKGDQRLPLPQKAGGAIGTKRGARGYRRVRSGFLPEEDLVGTHAGGRPSYEIIDHTADLGIRVRAESLEGLFETAGLTLFDLVTDLTKVRTVMRFAFSLKAENLEALFVSWLRELLYLFYGKKMVFGSLEITELDDFSLSVTCWGEKVDPARHAFLTEIKAVTYHDLHVVRAGSGWTASVIFDI